jgi:O-antigen ligase
MLRFWQIVFWISPALTLVVPSGHFVGPFFMALAGLFYWRQAAVNTPLCDLSIGASWEKMLGGFAVYVLVGVGLGLWHTNHAGYYEMFIPFVLFPAVGLLIRAGRCKIEPWVISMAIGASLAFIYAVYQVFVLDIGRAEGAAGNPIPFGNTAIVLATVALVSGVMLPFEGRFAKKKRIFVIAAGVAGVGASLLSGSKGGWMSLFIIGVSVVYLSTQHWAAWRRHLAALSVVVGILLAGLLAPTHVVQDRVISGVKGGWHWLQTGEVVEGSVGMRFEIWKLSLRIISEQPWVGHGSLGSRERWFTLLDEGQAHQQLVELVKSHPEFSTSDNEVLGTMRGGGVLGLLALMSLYGGVFLAFLGWRKHTDLHIRTLSTIGLIIVPVFLEFGLSVSVMGINVFRSTFVFLVISLLALMSVRLISIESLKRTPQVPE